jgi:hypothetical protein
VTFWYGSESAPLTYGSGSFWAYYIYISLRKKVKKVTKSQKIFKFYFGLFDGRIRIRTNNGGSGPKTCGSISGSTTMVLIILHYLFGEEDL